MSDSPLDLTSLPKEAWYEQVDAAFAGLPSQEVREVLVGGDPREVIRAFIQNHWGEFDWAPLQDGDGAWRFQIRKRGERGPNGISDMFSDDHRRCDDLFAQAEAAANQGEQAQAKMLFDRLNLGMERHFRMEEEGFFREVEKGMGFAGGGPTAVMREEHQQVRGILRRMAGAMDEENLDDFLAASETMLFMMEQHNMKEEQILYPMAEDILGAELEALLQRLYLF